MAQQLPLPGCLLLLGGLGGEESLVWFPLLTLELLKDKLRHIKIFKSLFEQKLIPIRQCQAESG